MLIIIGIGNDSSGHQQQQQQQQQANKGNNPQQGKVSSGPLMRRRKQLVVDNVSPTLANYVGKKCITNGAPELVQQASTSGNIPRHRNKANDGVMGNNMDIAADSAEITIPLNDSGSALPSKAPKGRKKVLIVSKDGDAAAAAAAAATTHSSNNESLSNMFPPVGKICPPSNKTEKNDDREYL